MKAAWAVENGAAEAVMKMSFGNGIGFASDPEAGAPWWGPMPGMLIAELTEEVSAPHWERIGVTTVEPAITIGGDSASIAELLKLNEGVLEEVYPTEAGAGGAVEPISWDKRSIAVCKHKAARPKAVIPVFPGTNCEYDTAQACLRAGMEPEIVVVRNLTPESLLASAQALEQAIR